MNLIGFSNKYYTLWSYSEEPLYTTIGEKSFQYGIKQNYNYIKNISFDLEKVKELYPDVTIDDDLRGKSESWSKEPKFVYPDEYFHFGKYEGSLISKCNDQSYLMWYFQNGVYNERYNIVKNRLIELGCAFYEDMIFSSVELCNEHIEKINNIEKREKEISEIYDKYKTPGIFYHNFYHSLDDQGRYGDRMFDIRFDDYSENFYAGYTYGLPRINGKAKRIKNKVLEMNVVTTINEFGDKYFKVLSVNSIKNIEE